MELSMNIAELFAKDINRSINGVIKVGQQDDTNIRQELEEYVVTEELKKHFYTFFGRFAESIESPTDKMGVWISGFFGSGKSHFLKILSYILENRSVGNNRALDYFDSQRIPDPSLLANIALAAQTHCDVILFNIDSKADANNKNDKENITKVFQKVFDDHLGYFGTTPEIARFERQLESKGKYQPFKEAFYRQTNQSWEETREAWAFYQDDIVAALTVSTGMSGEQANRLLEFNEKYTLSPEEFAKTVKEYLHTKGPKHRLVFMVDEVGQYIGEDTKLMLNLQTVVEDLGIHCQGRAWVLVTSQEAMDEITKNKIKGEDFSKIIGRFHRPLNLSSANTDEVIKLRLLSKTDEAKKRLEVLYTEKIAILRNQITFRDSADMPGYKDAQDFVAAYPFIPYQFYLLQKVFTQIRLMGSAGKHLASGERSLLDAFQVASQAISAQSLGKLVPFHTFYLAIEGFLDSVISQVITQATNNPQLKEFDIQLLKTLFMIKYIKEIRANLENLTTLSLTDIDEDRLGLKKQVAEALGRLEKQTLIQRNTDEYIFLTNEEQDIGKEIKNTRVNPGEIYKKLQEWVWESILTDREFKFGKRKYSFNRKLDERDHGKKLQELTVHIITPYGENYAEFENNTKCLITTQSSPELLIRLGNEDHLLQDLETFSQTDQYLRQKAGSNLSPSIQKIITARKDENTQREKNIKDSLQKLIASADVFSYGNKVEITRTEFATELLKQALTYLINNAYSKLKYIDSGFENSDQVKNALTRHIQEKTTDGEVVKDVNISARKDMESFLHSQNKYHPTTIKSLIDKFTCTPYGWSELDTLGIMAELANAGVVELRHAQNKVNLQEEGLIDKLLSRDGKETYIVRLASTIDPASLKVARDLASQLLDKNILDIPTESGKLFQTYEELLWQHVQRLKEWLKLTQEQQLPFGNLLKDHIAMLEELRTDNSHEQEFFQLVRGRRDDLEEYIDDLQKLRSFFTSQLKIFQEAQQSLKELKPELRHIEEEELLEQVKSVEEILNMDDPTSKIQLLPNLLKPVQQKIQEILRQKIGELHREMENQEKEIRDYIQEQYPAIVNEISEITQEINNFHPSEIKTIDSAIAHRSELSDKTNQLWKKIDAEAQKVQEKLGKSYHTANHIPEQVKPITFIQLGRFTPSKVLENEEDVEVYLGVLREEFLKQIQTGYRIRLER